MIKEDPAAAEVAGLRVGALVVQAFTLTSGITALAGCLLAYYTRDVSYQAFGLLIAINFIVMAVVGGLGSLNGAFAGSLVVTLLPTVLVQLVGQQSLTGPLASRLTYIDLAVYGLIGILLLQFRPGRTGRRIWTWWADRRRSPRKSKGDPAWNFNPTMLVELRGVSVQYAAGEIGLESIDMAVPPRGALAVLGRNGAGKTSLLYAIAGFPAGTGGRVQSGVVVWNRHGSPLRIESQAPEFRATQGIIMVPAEDKVFPQLTVGDHLREALVGRRASDGKVGLTAIFERFPLLRDRQAALAGTLSGGERQQLALAVALAKHARLLLVDEATLGLAPIMVLSVGALLKAIASQEAVSIMVVEQNPEVAFSLANQVILLDDGKIELVGAPSPDLRVQIERSYLGIGGIVGDHPEALEPQVPAKPSLGAALSSRPVVLDVREAGLRIGGVMPLDDVSLALRAGQVVGLVGPNGAGKTSLLNAISGYYQLDRGSIHVSGVEVRGRSPHGVVELGVSRSFQAVGHVADLTVADLVMIGFEASWKTGVVVTYLGLPMGGRAERRARQEATSMLEDSGLLPYSDIRLRDCPYGIRKMADLLRAFAGRPRLLLLDEPTSGVSDTERPEIARLLRQYLDRSGAAALVVDHDVDFVSSLCNELVVLAAGRKIAEGPTKDVLKAVAVRRAFTGRLESDDDAATV
jgi:ABC-type branched-subunit amino acid transport system ATPase component